MTSLLLSLVLFSAAVQAVPAEKGTLCILEKDGQQCSAVEGKTVAVAATDAARRFVWSSADGKRMLLGVIPPRATAISIEEKGLSQAALGIDGDRRRGWPAAAHVTLQNGGEEWAFPIDAKVVGKLRAVQLPAGTYRMRIAAEHHITDERKLDATKDVTVGQISLEPLPVISGRVLNTKEEPIARAQILRPDGVVQAIADEQGQFRTELAEPLPGEVVIVQTGFASALLSLLNLSGDVDLGVIHLGTGRNVTLRLVYPDEDVLPLRVHLMREQAQKYAPTPIAARTIEEKQDVISFRDVSAGSYVVLLEGQEPLERLSKKLEVEESDVEAEIRIAPFRLQGSVRVGEELLRSGTVELQDAAHSWRTSLAIDDRGEFGGRMWHGGKVSAFVTAPSIHELVRSPELGSDPSVWDVAFPSRYLRGRIFDEGTKQSVADASLSLQFAAGETRSNSRSTVQPDGSYSILAIKAGTYELRVEAPDYVPSRATVEVGRDDEGERNVDFPLARGVRHVLEVMWPSGAAVAGAAVLEGVASDGMNPERSYTTDGAGRLTLTLRRNEVRTLYILPREGSFGVARVAAPEEPDAAPLRVTVPSPGAALRAQMRDARDEAVPAMLLFRFNGELIPPPVIMRLTGQFESAPMLHAASLPAGAYELWGVALPPHAQAALVGRIPRRPPVRIGLTAGEQSVTLLAAPLD